MPRKLNDTESVVIYALPYYQKLTNLLKGTKKRFVGILPWDMQILQTQGPLLLQPLYFSRVLANYILWRFIRHRLNNLDARFQGVQQELYR